MPTWNAELYLQFANERTQPSRDLVARIAIANPSRIIDLGCGPGNSTAMLRERWPQAKIIGLDSSPQMIEAASAKYPDGQWILADAAWWEAEEPFDVVFSNATLQWLPNHATLFPHLLNQVAPGGALAVQMPAHYQSLSRQVLLEVASRAEWASLLEGARHSLTTETPAFYYDVLESLATRLEIWETEYCHIMDSPQAIVNWFRGTGLRPFLEALQDEEKKQRFEGQLLEGYMRAYPVRPNGKVLFPFRRLFVIAYK